MVWGFFSAAVLSRSRWAHIPTITEWHRQVRKREKKLLSKHYSFCPQKPTSSKNQWQYELLADCVTHFVLLASLDVQWQQQGDDGARAHSPHFRSNRRYSHKLPKLTWCLNACCSKVISANLWNLLGFKQRVLKDKNNPIKLLLLLFELGSDLLFEGRVAFLKIYLNVLF